MARERPMCWDCAVRGRWHLMAAETGDRFACYRIGLLHVPRDVIEIAWEQWRGPGVFGPDPQPVFIAGPFSTNRAWRRHGG